MAYIEFDEQGSRNDSLMLNKTFYKNNVIYVNKQCKEIPVTAGKKEKWKSSLKEIEIILDLSE